MNFTSNNDIISKTGYVWDELFMFHYTGTASEDFWTEPTNLEHWENAEGKRRIHTLLFASGLGDKLTRIPAIDATIDELLMFHKPAYLEQLQQWSKQSIGLWSAGEGAPYSPGAFQVALRACGGVIEACRAVIRKEIRNAYALVRPPGKYNIGVICIDDDV